MNQTIFFNHPGSLLQLKGLNIFWYQDNFPDMNLCIETLKEFHHPVFIFFPDDEYTTY